MAALMQYHSGKEDKAIEKTYYSLISHDPEEYIKQKLGELPPKKEKD
jgi:hypothetical protein